MRLEQIEVYSDATNAAIMRHPARVFSGVMIQGETLSIMVMQVERLCEQIDRNSETFDDADDLREQLRALLGHYRSVMVEHGLKLPFYD